MLDLSEVRRLSQTGNVIPIQKDLLPDLDTPITALLKLRRNAHLPFLLESVELGEKLARYSFLGRNPIQRFRARGRRIDLEGFERRSYEGDPLADLRMMLNRFRAADAPGLPPFAGGAVGFMCYDAIRLVEKIPDTGRDDYELPDLDFGFYDAFVVFDHIKHRLSLVACVMPDLHGGNIETAYVEACNRLAELEAELAKPLTLSEIYFGSGLREKVSVNSPPKNNPAESLTWNSNMDPETYLAGVARCKEFIQAGDAFQIVLSQRFEGKPGIDALNVYRALRTVNPSPYMYYLDYGSFEVVGASPETLVKVQDGLCETKPIAGTRRRGETEAEDIALEKDLLADPKEIAEHVMLVDLGRNDIGRVAEYGSVRVTKMMQVERHSHVMHIYSVVQGQLRKGLHPLDALMSCLPAGTLSGAPKIRAMEIIDSLEPTRRGLYGGAICYLDFRGNLDSCIVIRTLLFKDGIAYLQAGAGIVADSVPQSEFEETGHKAKAGMAAVDKARSMLRPGD